MGRTALTHEVAAAPDDIHQVDRNLRLIESVGFEVSDRSLTIQIPEVAQRSVRDRLNQFGNVGGSSGHCNSRG